MNYVTILTTVEFVGAVGTVVFAVTSQIQLDACSIVASELISCARSRRRSCRSRCTNTRTHAHVEIHETSANNDNKQL